MRENFCNLMPKEEEEEEENPPNHFPAAWH